MISWPQHARRGSISYLPIGVPISYIISFIRMHEASTIIDKHQTCFQFKWFTRKGCSDINPLSNKAMAFLLYSHILVDRSSNIWGYSSASVSLRMLCVNLHHITCSSETLYPKEWLTEEVRRRKWGLWTIKHVSNTVHQISVITSILQNEVNDW